MDHALVLGADTRFGQAICRRLTSRGFRVFALARDFDNNPWEHPDFVKLPIDLTDTAAVAKQIDDIHDAGGVFSLVVNAIHYLPSQSEFDHIPVGELEAVLRLHLNLPIIAARLTLNDLSQSHGNFVHIVPSVPAGTAPSVSVLAAQEPLKAALNALQSERHHTGLRITHVYPYFLGSSKSELAGTSTEEVKVGMDSQSRLDPESVADVIEELVTGREGNFATEIHIRPRTPRDAAPLARTLVKPSGYSAITLPPPEKAAPGQELIPTAKPTTPVDVKDRPVTYADVIDSYDEEAEEEFERRISGVSNDDPEDEDFEGDEPEASENVSREEHREKDNRRKPKKQREPKPKKEKEDKGDSEDKPVSAKTLRNRERRRKWKERKAKERAEAREKKDQDGSSETTQDTPPSEEKPSVDPALKGHAAAIAAAKSSSEDTESSTDSASAAEPTKSEEPEKQQAAPKKAPRKKAAPKKKRAPAKKVTESEQEPKVENSELSEEKPAAKKRAAPKKKAAKKKTPAKKKVAAKKKRAPAKKAPEDESEKTES
ncbi:MAG: SDR family NAD(P)-dependent oxidoreductase [Opitutales bacterium]